MKIWSNSKSKLRTKIKSFDRSGLILVAVALTIVGCEQSKNQTGFLNGSGQEIESTRIGRNNSVLQIVDGGVPAFKGGGYKGKSSRSPIPVSTPRLEMNPELWMTSGYSSKSNIQLRNICIPGTHDSGTYGIQGVDENISQTQELTIGEQLSAGYRYFDLRIKKNNGQFVLHHGPSISVAASVVFQDLANFANAHPQEVLIVHIQNVDSMSDSEHYELKDQLVIPYLGARMAPRSLGNGVTFQQLWSSNKNVMLLWGGGNYADLSSLYWNQGDTMNSDWQNTGSESTLISGLRDRIKDNRNGKFYVAQMILTPNASQIIFPPYFGSIEDLTNDKLDHASLVYDLDMYAKKSGQRINIAMVDFAGHRFGQYAFEACMDVNDLEPRFFSLHNKLAPSLCLDVNQGSTENNARVQLWTCNNTSAQKWWYEHASSRFRSKLNTNKCLDNGGENWNTGKIVLYDCLDSDNMRFDFMDDTIRVRQNSNFAIDASSNTSGSIVYQYSFHGRDNQRWDKSYESPYFALINKASNLCLDVNQGDMTNNNKIQVWNCNGSDAQRWYYDSSNKFIRSKVNPYKCLDNGGETANGGKIAIWDCLDMDNMRFDFIDDTIRNHINNTYAVDANGTSSGSKVSQWQFHGGNNQRWSIGYDQ
ncbi:hypothetical protein CH373_15605 [Leptospira perolatii]|uniref:1-phosphatidylinositol phosphodiesterase n=1 Tax=Leptospira perolatii TaxID=2023191 RepID=A0A2M9ZJD3_9LEPT|nr:ricin-type beta-trefoil lectin domain protein [Leptospira perolatii]PJZ68839.1 hypothetical protein CH360_14065 [Leptospira perolatii]PJZ72170.1 hypothetical protein CH373_15605 [Leptospira perolatii]